MKFSLTTKSLFLLTTICLVATQMAVASVSAHGVLRVKTLEPTYSDVRVCSRAGLDGIPVGLNMHYRGAQPLRGYLVAVYYKPSSVEELGYLYRSYMSLPDEAVIKPGKTWHATLCGLPHDVDVRSVSAESDLLIYDDNTISGPMRLREASYLYGMTMGASLIMPGAVTPTWHAASAKVAPIVGTPALTESNSLPLRFTAAVQEVNGRPSLLVDAANTGTQPIVGYEFTISFFDHALGSFVRSVTTKMLTTTGKSSDYLLPGAEWTSEGRRLSVSSDGALDNYKISVDAVLLADGTVLGPQKSREADELFGTAAGIKLAALRARYDNYDNAEE